MASLLGSAKAKRIRVTLQFNQFKVLKKYQVSHSEIKASLEGLA
jgi:hypothetical protein